MCVTGEPNFVLEQKKASPRRRFLDRGMKYKQKLFNEEYTRQCRLRDKGTEVVRMLENEELMS